MFQIGRMLVSQNDFVIRGPLHLDAQGILCGPVSRYGKIVSEMCIKIDGYGALVPNIFKM